MVFPVGHLDPKLDVVFRLLLTRKPRLLRDMLEGILARSIRGLEVVDPCLDGEQIDDKQVIFDVRAVLDDGTRVDVEMQQRRGHALTPRLVYYVARDYAEQLGPGESYGRLQPTIGITWLLEPLLPWNTPWHSVFELRERRVHRRLSDQLSIHLLQLSSYRPSKATRYRARVERWARFFLARDEAELDELAMEHPIMTLAKQTLEQLSLDPDARRIARRRADEFKLREIELSTTRAEGLAEGRSEGEARMLTKLLTLRFGAVPDALVGRIEAATPSQREEWVERGLTARSLTEVFGT